MVSSDLEYIERHNKMRMAQLGDGKSIVGDIISAVSPAYVKLRSVLDKAYEQSAHGKGKERHANDKPFDRQPILEIGRMVGPGFALGQVMKKAQEASGMAGRSSFEAAQAELLGVIVYAAAAHILLDELADGPVTAQAGTEKTG